MSTIPAHADDAERRVVRHVVPLVLRVAIAVSLTVDAVVHLRLASGYQQSAPLGIGAGNLFRIEAVQSAKNAKYILLNCPNDCVDKITKVLPGAKSPTILPLKEAGGSSIHSVVNENDFWEKIDLLKSLGAEGILVIPIEKMIA